MALWAYVDRLIFLEFCQLKQRQRRILVFLLHLTRPERQLCAHCTCHEVIFLKMMKQPILCSHLVSATKICLRIQVKACVSFFSSLRI